MVESTVNSCHYESVTIKIWMPLYKEIHGLCFMYGKLWILMVAFLPYLYITQIHVFSIGQETMAVQKFLN